MAITYSGQDSETTTVLNCKCIKHDMKTIISDQVKSEQLGDEIKKDSKLSV